MATVSTTKNGVMKLYRAEPTTISVSDGTLSSTPALALTVATAALNKFSLLPETTTPAAGAEDDLTITAQDTYANTVTSYGGSHELTFSGASASPSGTTPTVSNSSGTPVAFATPTAINFVAGVATESEGANGEMRLYKSGATSVKVAEGSVSSATVTVTPAIGEGGVLSFVAVVLAPPPARLHRGESKPSPPPPYSPAAQSQALLRGEALLVEVVAQRLQLRRLDPIDVIRLGEMA